MILHGVAQPLCLSPSERGALMKFTKDRPASFALSANAWGGVCLSVVILLNVFIAHASAGNVETFSTTPPSFPWPHGEHGWLLPFLAAPGRASSVSVSFPTMCHPGHWQAGEKTPHVSSPRQLEHAIHFSSPCDISPLCKTSLPPC